MDSRAPSLIAVLALVLLAAWIEAGFAAGEWYLYLHKPVWSLPAWGFMLAWPAFHLLMAMAAWRLWLDQGLHAATPLAMWIAVLVVLVAWFWLLFGLHRPGWALAGATVLAVLAGVARARFRISCTAASRLLTPCLAWLAYIWVWNLVVWRLAGGGVDTIFN